MQKENQRVVITKLLIKKALLKLLQKQHINKISISELCQVAQINRTTFYRHYETPRSVLQEIAFDLISSFSEQFPSVKCAIDLKEFITQLCDFLYGQKSVVTILIRNDTELDFTKMTQLLSNRFLRSRTILYRGKAVDPDTLQLFTTFFSAGMYALISQWLTEDIPKTSKEIADLVCCSLNRDFIFQPQ